MDNEQPTQEEIDEAAALEIIVTILRDTRSRSAFIYHLIDGPPPFNEEEQKTIDRVFAAYNRVVDKLQEVLDENQALVSMSH